MPTVYRYIKLHLRVVTSLITTYGIIKFYVQVGISQTTEGTGLKLHTLIVI
jgi:hypothetical protein